MSGGAQIRQLRDREVTAEQAEPAIRSGHQPRGVDVLERPAETLGDLVDRLYPAPADVHHPEQDSGSRVALEQAQVVRAVCILDRDRINRSDYGSIDDTSSTISSWRAAMSSDSPVTMDSIWS